MQARFTHRITQLPAPLAAAVAPLLTEHFSGFISHAQLQQLAQQSQMAQDEMLLALLPLAAALANPPISEFYVGAIAIGATGNAYMGANLELNNNALCQTVHAEQSAISHAWLRGEQRIVDLIVNASPCGHCRQFINELVDGAAIRIHLPQQATQPLSYYLPFAFGPKDLNITMPLLSEQQHTLHVESDDELVQLALTQANRSYAPYSGNYSAVVMETNNGQRFAGRYAENAAFNPSMMPLQMALADLLRYNLEAKDISRVVLLESNAGKISLRDATASALASICDVKLEYIQAQPSC